MHIRSGQLQFAERHKAHAEKQPAVLPSADFDFTVAALAIANRHINDFVVKAGCTEEKVEITKRVKIPKIGTVRSDSLIIMSPQNLGPAESVLDPLAKQLGEQTRKKIIGDHIQKTHRLLFHRID